MNSRTSIGAVVVMCALTACPGPDVYRCDPVTGADCTPAADAGTDYSGAWTMKVTLEPRNPPVGRSFFSSSSTIESVVLTRADGGWNVEIPGEGGLACTPAPFVEATADGLALPAQAFKVRKGTPMKVDIVGMATLNYRSLDPWSVTLSDRSTASMTNNSIRFARGTGQTVEDGATDPIMYVHSVEFTR